MTTSVTNVPEHLRVDLDIFDPGLTTPVDRFQEEMARLAAISPVVYSTAHGGHWIVTGYEQVHEVLRNPALFSSWPNNIMPHGGEKTLPIELDPPEHTAYRQALQPLFSPARMNALETQIRATVNELIDSFAARGRAEFVTEFAHELPARIFLALMDLPLEDAPLFTEATDTFIVGRTGVSKEESDKAREDALMRMLGYFAQVVAERRGRPDPGEDVTSLIIQTPITLSGETRPLADAELCNMFFLLLIAGLHTVQGSLAWAVAHLSANADQRQKLIDDPSLIPTAVEEVLRYEAAVLPGRRVTEDTTLGGVPLKAGDQLLLSLGGANRDESEFEAASSMDVERNPNRHLSFGAGPHRCVGSHLARIELRIALEELHRRIPDYRLDPDDAPVWHGSQVRGANKLPIVFTPVAAD